MFCGSLDLDTSPINAESDQVIQEIRCLSCSNKEILLNPESLAEGLQGMREETLRSNQSLFDRQDMIAKRILETERQLEKLLDLYLINGFPKEMLQERKSRLEETLASLHREQADISDHLRETILSDEQILDIEAYCSQIRQNLECTTFEQKRQIIDMLDVRGTLAIENDEKVVYVKCILGQQLLSVARTSHLSSIGAISTIRCASRQTVRYR